jgi:hypothetical protein
VAILAVDLAAKLSAACLMDGNYQVLDEFDSFGSAEDDFIARIVSTWTCPAAGQDPAALVIEDLPHGLNYSRLVKSVLRLQGRIVQAVDWTYRGSLADIVFVAPNTWRAHYPAAKRGTGSDISVPIAEGYGYQPPSDLLQRAKGRGGPTRARKIASDYCAAYLIARWAVDTHRFHHTFDVPGTSRYGTDPIRKKDFDAESSSHAQDS